MSENYSITVDAVDADGEKTTLVSGVGPVRVLYYLANVGQEGLSDLGEEAEAAVSIYQGDKKILNFTGDAESAEGLLKARVLKLRRALAASETPAETATA